ncbi:uncharacterized protein LOC114240922 [Bombyx mandarina]|uniref:Uncharacterized protein LOC114240922 n=1 Tax=Bombyx mandarina TaxID=7092 RepID=A0A6J2JD51_BOMMA|nr:uncharacterized protein LOC114240922 [Bombyx mandarina]
MLKTFVLHNLCFILHGFIILISFNYVNGYSSFWAPLYDPTILNYRVNAKFEPNLDKKVIDEYKNVNGYRSEKFIANLGNGKGVNNFMQNGIQEPVSVYYTYRGAHN